MRQRAEVLLAGGPAGRLVVRALALQCEGQQLDVILDGELLAAHNVTCGAVNLRLPVPASDGARRVELRWARTRRLAADDPREVAARLEYLDLAPLRPPSVLRLPQALATPGLEYDGIDGDGWLRQEAYVVLAGGAPADLTLRADVLQASSQGLELAVEGEVVFSELVAPGPLALRLPLGPANGKRHVELRWRTAVPLSEEDPRPVTALLKLVGIGAGEPPPALRSFPDDLLHAQAQYAGIHDDGWLAQDARVVLRGGRAGTLVLRAEPLPLDGQRLQVALDGETLYSEAVAAEPVTVRVPVPATAAERNVELRWGTAGTLGGGDARRVAARLGFVGVVAGRPRAVIRPPADLADPELAHGGAYPDGWLEQESWFELAGGGPIDLAVRAHVADPVKGPGYLDVVVDGLTLASQRVTGPSVDLRLPLQPKDGPRRVELRWPSALPISSTDSRRVAARLEFLGLVSSAAR